MRRSMRISSHTIAAVLLPFLCTALAAIPGLRLCPLKGVENYALELCDCAETFKNCNPFCLGTYIQCGGSVAPSPSGIRAAIKACPAGQLFDFYFDKCVKSKAGAPGICPGGNLTLIKQSKSPITLCDSAACFCDTRPPGQYPNPYDAYPSSYIVCVSYKGAPRGTSELQSIVDCPYGNIYNPAKAKCTLPTKTGPQLPKDPCRSVSCFCLFRRKGIYDNPYDFDQASAIECSGCGEVQLLLVADKGYYFNGTGFSKIPRKGLEPQCALELAGVRGSGAVLAELLTTLLSNTPFPTQGITHPPPPPPPPPSPPPPPPPSPPPPPAPPAPYYIIEYPGSGLSPTKFYVPPTPAFLGESHLPSESVTSPKQQTTSPPHMTPPVGRRKLLTPRAVQPGYVGLVLCRTCGVVGASCDKKGNPCIGKGSTWVVYKCKLLKCEKNCFTSAGNKKVC